MKIFYKAFSFLIYIISILLISSCGGGARSNESTSSTSNTSNTSPSNPGDWLEIKPAAVELQTIEGFSKTIKINGTAHKTFAQNINIGIVDSVGVITTNVAIDKNSSTSYTLTIQSSPSLKAGTHFSNISVRLCEDDPIYCRKPLPGSPWTLPFKITVLPASNLTPLQSFQQGVAWNSVQGNAAHTNFVNQTIDPRKVSVRWIFDIDRDSFISGLAIENGNVLFIKRRDPNWGGDIVWDCSLISLNEADGKVNWSASLGIMSDCTEPIVNSGKVFALTNGRYAYDNQAHLRVFDQSNGKLLNQLALQRQQHGFTTPALLGDDIVFFVSPNDRGVSRYSITQNKIISNNTRFVTSDYWDPAVDQQNNYAVIYGSFYAIQNSDGKVVFTINIPNFVNNGLTDQTLTVLSGNGMAYSTIKGYGVTPSRLVAFDIQKRVFAWSISNPLGISNPAYANDVVYITAVTEGYATDAVGQLQAYSSRTGTLLWALNLKDLGLDGGGGTPLLTQNLLFLSSGGKTIAINLSTKKVVWELPISGSLSMSSNGILYIDSLTPRKLIAVNLN